MDSMDPRLTIMKKLIQIFLVNLAIATCGGIHDGFSSVNVPSEEKSMTEFVEYNNFCSQRIFAIGTNDVLSDIRGSLSTMRSAHTGIDANISRTFNDQVFLLNEKTMNFGLKKELINIRFKFWLNRELSLFLAGKKQKKQDYETGHFHDSECLNETAKLLIFKG